jgi:hypothetical protein
MRKQFQPWFRALVVIVVAVTLLLTGCKATVKNPTQTSSPGPVADLPPGDGITVHGNWTIEVRDPGAKAAPSPASPPPKGLPA